MFLKILLTIFLIFGGVNFASAQQLNLNSELPLNLNPLKAVDADGVKIINTQDMLKGFKFLPFNVKSLNIDTNIPISPKFNPSQGLPDIDLKDLKQFLTLKDVSSNDLTEAAKAIITLVIEIFLVVLSIASQILKSILDFLR